MLYIQALGTLILAGNAFAKPIHHRNLVHRQASQTTTSSTSTSTTTSTTTTSATTSSTTSGCLTTNTATASEQCSEIASSNGLQSIFGTSLTIPADSSDCSSILGFFGICIASATSTDASSTTASSTTTGSTSSSTISTTPTSTSSISSTSSSSTSSSVSTLPSSQPSDLGSFTSFSKSTTLTQILSWTEEIAFTSTETTTEVEVLTVTGESAQVMQTTIAITEASPDVASSTSDTTSPTSSSLSSSTSSTSTSTIASTTGATTSASDTVSSSTSSTTSSTSSSISSTSTASTSSSSSIASSSGSTVSITSIGSSTKSSSSTTSVSPSQSGSVTDINNIIVTRTRTTTLGTPAATHVASVQSTGLTTSVSVVPENENTPVDAYTPYTGNGTTAAGWPCQDQWVDFDYMFNANAANMQSSCAQWNVPNNSDDEMAAMKNAILKAANDSGVDARFVLATVLQASSGCVRVVTTYSDIANPGLMQSRAGTGTCNSNIAALDLDQRSTCGVKARANVQYPCPASSIVQQITDGVLGTENGDGLVQLLRKQGRSDVSQFYRAARLYNGGNLHESGDLSLGCCISCYASDIANRLTGWVNAPSTCDS